MTFAYLLFAVMLAILSIGAYLEDRRRTQMEQTVKAILARCNGNGKLAYQYCVGVSNTATNPHLKREYKQLAELIATIYEVKSEAAHV